MMNSTPKTKPRRRASAVTHRAGSIAPAAFDGTATGDADGTDLSPSLEFDLDSDEESGLEAIFDEPSGSDDDAMIDDPIRGGPRRR